MLIRKAYEAKTILLPKFFCTPEVRDASMALFIIFIHYSADIGVFSKEFFVGIKWTEAQKPILPKHVTLLKIFGVSDEKKLSQTPTTYMKIYVDWPIYLIDR